MKLAIGPQDPCCASPPTPNHTLSDRDSTLPASRLPRVRSSESGPHPSTTTHRLISLPIRRHNAVRPMSIIGMRISQLAFPLFLSCFHEPLVRRRPWITALDAAHDLPPWVSWRILVMIILRLPARGIRIQGRYWLRAIGREQPCYSSYPPTTCHCRNQAHRLWSFLHAALSSCLLSFFLLSLPPIIFRSPIQPVLVLSPALPNVETLWMKVRRSAQLSLTVSIVSAADGNAFVQLPSC